MAREALRLELAGETVKAVAYTSRELDVFMIDLCSSVILP
jgi:hypothetical protein